MTNCLQCVEYKYGTCERTKKNTQPYYSCEYARFGRSGYPFAKCETCIYFESNGFFFADFCEAHFLETHSSNGCSSYIGKEKEEEPEPEYTPQNEPLNYYGKRTASSDDYVGLGCILLLLSPIIIVFVFEMSKLGINALYRCISDNIHISLPIITIILTLVMAKYITKHRYGIISIGMTIALGLYFFFS